SVVPVLPPFAHGGMQLDQQRVEVGQRAGQGVTRQLAWGHGRGCRRLCLRLERDPCPPKLQRRWEACRNERHRQRQECSSVVHMRPLEECECQALGAAPLDPFGTTMNASTRASEPSTEPHVECRAPVSSKKISPTP